MPIAKAGDIDISYERAGAGPPLILIMGMSGTLMHWGEPLLKLLRASFDTIAYDHRGVGQSSRLTGPITIAGLAEDAAELMQTLEIDSAHVFGISMGGMVAQELAISHPQRIRTLTLGCTYSGGEGSALTGEAVLRRLAQAMACGDREQAIRTAWEANVSRAFAERPGAYEQFRDIGMQYAVAVEVITEQLRAIAGHDTSLRLSQITAPTLVIHGTEDEMLPASNAHMIADRIPDARLEIIEGAGHLFFWEQPEHSAALVRQHIAVHV